MVTTAALRAMYFRVTRICPDQRRAVAGSAILQMAVRAVDVARRIAGKAVREMAKQREPSANGLPHGIRPDFRLGGWTPHRAAHRRGDRAEKSGTALPLHDGGFASRRGDRLRLGSWRGGPVSRRRSREWPRRVRQTAPGSGVAGRGRLPERCRSVRLCALVVLQRGVGCNKARTTVCGEGLGTDILLQMPREGLEPSTYALKGRSSTIELSERRDHKV